MSSLSEPEIHKVLLFMEKADELELAKNRNKKPPIYSFSIEQSARVETFSSKIPEYHVVEYLAMKFRFFYAESESTKFEKILGLVISKCSDEYSRSYLYNLNSYYKSQLSATSVSGKLGFPKSNSEIINLWFNSHFFHSDLEKREKLGFINSLISKEASLCQLYVALTGLVQSISYLRLALYKFTKEEHIVCTPSHQFKK